MTWFRCMKYAGMNCWWCTIATLSMFPPHTRQLFLRLRSAAFNITGHTSPRCLLSAANGTNRFLALALMVPVTETMAAFGAVKFSPVAFAKVLNALLIFVVQFSPAVMQRHIILFKRQQVSCSKLMI